MGRLFVPSLLLQGKQASITEGHGRREAKGRPIKRAFVWNGPFVPVVQSIQRLLMAACSL